MFVSMLLICLQFSSPEYQAEAAGRRIGRIIIEGNDSTPQWIILSAMRLVPGQKVQALGLAMARDRLRASQIFRLDQPPEIEVLPDGLDNRFVDLRIRICDRPENWYILQLPVAVFYVTTQLHEAVGQMVLDTSVELFDWNWRALEGLAEACHK